MFVVVFFVIAMALLGTRAEDRSSTPVVVAALSFVCAAMLFSFRFA